MDGKSTVGKAAIVTGGRQGLGETICRKLAENGNRVVIADINFENAKKVSDSINKEFGSTETEGASHKITNHPTTTSAGSGTAQGPVSIPVKVDITKADEQDQR